MVRARLRSVSARLRRALGCALAEQHTPREVAGSFALGTFITMLPTLGAGVLVFFLIAPLSARISKIALFSSVIVFNPVVKWGVYALSFAIGVALLGPVDGVSASSVSIWAGPAIVARLLLGNLLLATLATVVGYVVAYKVAVHLENSELGELLEEAVDDFVEEELLH